MFLLILHFPELQNIRHLPLHSIMFLLIRDELLESIIDK